MLTADTFAPYREETISTRIQNVIAFRVMTYTRTDGNTFPVNVNIGDLIFVPATSLEVSGHWQASVQVFGCSSIDSRVYHCTGEDSVQALSEALTFAGTILSSSSIATKIDFANVPNFGFPVLLQNRAPALRLVG